jgi:hypothetical protein
MKHKNIFALQHSLDSKGVKTSKPKPDNMQTFF